MRRQTRRTFYSIIIALLLLFLMAGQESAGESVTTLRNQTIMVTGTWEKNTAGRIPFAIDDFQGFKYLNLSYQMLNPTAATSNDCGLVFLLTTDEYFASWKNGSNMVYAPVGESKAKVFNTGFITFDPRMNPEPSWQKGKYWLIAKMKPVNCVNEAHIRLDLIREGEGIPATAMATPQGTTPRVSPQATTSAPTITLRESASPPEMTQAAGAPGTQVATTTKAPLPVSITMLSVMLAVHILGWRRNRR